MDPANYTGVRDSSKPNGASELWQYLHFMELMSNYIPQFTERAVPLQDLFEEAYKSAGRSTKRIISKQKMKQLRWNEDHTAEFRGLQEHLLDAVNTAHRDPSTSLCVHCDARDTFCAADFTKFAPSYLYKFFTD